MGVERDICLPNRANAYAVRDEQLLHYSGIVFLFLTTALRSRTDRAELENLVVHSSVISAAEGSLDFVGTCHVVPLATTKFATTPPNVLEPEMLIIRDQSIIREQRNTIGHVALQHPLNVRLDQRGAEPSSLVVW